jgi:hypothetical protein
MRNRKTVRRRPRGRAGVSSIIAAILMISITLVAGTVLWSLRFNFPSTSYYVTYYATAGLKIPVWGDHTDCTPYGYPQSDVKKANWGANETNAWNYYCQNHEIGNFSLMNASSITIASVSPANLPLKNIYFYFLCHNTTPVDNTTVLVGGSLGSMTWFPGKTGGPAPNAPTLGWCANFDANGDGAFSTLYNRLAMFTPINNNSQVLEPGDTLIVYVHTPKSVFDVDSANGLDTDDYHGAPPWCFNVPGACTIQLIYQGTGTTQLLASIPIYSISGQAQ